MDKFKELLKENERLQKQLVEEEDKYAKEGKSWGEMFNLTLDIRRKISDNDREARLIKNPIMQFGKNWAGDLMSLEDFINRCQNNFYTDDDGHGRYATETGVSDITIYPSDILENKYRHDFSHVIWFNKGNNIQVYT